MVVVTEVLPVTLPLVKPQSSEEHNWFHVDKIRAVMELLWHPLLAYSNHSFSNQWKQAQAQYYPLTLGWAFELVTSTRFQTVLLQIYLTAKCGLRNIGLGKFTATDTTLKCLSAADVWALLQPCPPQGSHNIQDVWVPLVVNLLFIKHVMIRLTRTSLWKEFYSSREAGRWPLGRETKWWNSKLTLK